jgi:hypothetical protein
MPYISAASREKKAGSETVLLKVAAGNSTSDSRLSGASQAVQPEDRARIVVCCPVIYFLKQLNPGVGKAYGVVLLIVSVEERVRGIRQLLKRAIYDYTIC